MFHHQIYDLSRQVHAEYNAKFNGLYVPMQDPKPGLVSRLLALLPRSGTDPKHTPVLTHGSHQVAGTAAR